ncbi:DeoR/GlpR family DNA-binding transcription regulator [Amnibacterium setariae]|uniref:DeoR/GlpR transcriptional regulator n=1 Tax=Amnibacterium setariae TaxID=2306585 RepID=A0A3A1TSG7_9MICO|nr:DeoR/GlpR family DNA-binding transcription regulator [Amnibacterium setariae]RIX26645.1 DeoR/GlpR transcriptional regulator [Amnibacterium setariae]
MVMLGQGDEGGRRLPAGRKAELASYVAEVGEASVARLAERFEVSVDTIRRDLDALDAEGHLIRTHGGAVSVTAAPRPEFGVDVRLRMQSDAKDAIGALAARLVADGMVLMMNAGTTTQAIARHLRDRRELTIATNSLTLPAVVPPEVVRDLYVFGGEVRFTAQETIGPVVFPIREPGMEQRIQADLAFIGVGSVSEDGGYWTSNLAEAGMMRDMADRSAKVAIVADATKFERRLFAQVGDLAAADYLITDAPPPPSMARALADAGVVVLTPDEH